MEDNYDEWDIGYEAGYKDGYARGRYEEHLSASDTIYRAKLMIEELADENDELKIQIRNARALLEAVKEQNEVLAENSRLLKEKMEDMEHVRTD